MGLTTREEDFVEQIFTTSTHHHILFFTNRGIVYRLKGYQIPEATRQAKGTAIVNLLPLEQGEKISAIMPVKDFEKGLYLTFITKNGLIKKTDMMDYARIRQSGLKAIELVEDDELIQVQLTDGEEDLIVATHNGLSIRFNEKDVRSMGRTTRGVKAITLSKGDYVIGVAVVDNESKLLAVTENGYGKKTEFDEYRAQSRGGKGIFTYKITERTGKLAGIKSVTDNEDIIIITSEGIIIRVHTDEISTYGRQAQGVRVVKLGEGVNVVSLAMTAREECEEDSDNEEETSE